MSLIVVITIYLTKVRIEIRSFQLLASRDVWITTCHFMRKSQLSLVTPFPRVNWRGCCLILLRKGEDKKHSIERFPAHLGNEIIS